MKTEKSKEKKLNFDLPDDPQDLMLMILDNYPEEDAISLKKVMSIGRIKYQDKLPGGAQCTAAVVNTKPYTLLYGKSFIEENLEDIEDLVYLNAHELTHLVLDHFAEDIIKEFKEARTIRKANGEEIKYEGLGYDAMHIIVDCQVNATVCNSLTDEKYHKFIKKYYPQNKMPYCFFRPDGEPDGEDLTAEMKEDLKKLHAKLYSESGITNKELIEGLMPWFEKMDQEQMDEFKKQLLGNHEDVLKNRAGNSCSEELENLAETVARNYLNKKNKEEDGKAGGEGNEKSEAGNQDGNGEKPGGALPGKGGDLREVMIEVSLERIEYAKNIRDKLKNPLVMSPSSRIYRAIDQYSPRTPVRTVVPNFHDRRTSAIYSTGTMPVFHRANIIGSKVKVPCYLDVSGSQDHMIPVMIPVVGRLKRLIGDVVYCFSTEVSETKIAELQRGKYKTTGGTNFNPVLKHILKNRFKQAVILTDGQAYADQELLDKIKKMNIDITVGWTEKRVALQPLSSIASKTFYVFGEEDA